METLIALKKNVIQKELEQIQTTIQKEQKKFFIRNKYMQTTSQYQKRVNAAIKNRRQHMIERANYMKQFRLSASFNLTDHRLSTNDSYK
ncbi:unnamed protein product [Adineta ricciae]|uniref:Uncharacterized protein n=1 Tax=Adineta ricciae TaxID=249248 RepID=A0A815L672_ADIRI|nr:unnamed protein product [Adineta ricciae]CAF1456626.1 unnamed protein product [Adineta ricciae]